MLRILVISTLLGITATAAAEAPKSKRAPQAPSFQRIELEHEYWSEGVGFSDLDRDGHADVVYGPQPVCASRARSRRSPRNRCRPRPASSANFRSARTSVPLTCPA